MKKLIALALIGVLSGAGYAKYEQSTDQYIRERVLMLKGNGVACSAVRVKVGMKYYVLTAGHCIATMLPTKTFVAEDEHGKDHVLKLIKVREDKDLMLLTSDVLDGIDIADQVYRHQHVHVIAHGNAEPSYRVDGELLKEEALPVIKSLIFSPEDARQCRSKPYQKVMDTMLFSYCAIILHSMRTSCHVLGGASGGPLLDAWGHLVGIVSNGDESLSGMVTLHDIKDFVRDIRR